VPSLITAASRRWPASSVAAFCCICGRYCVCTRGRTGGCGFLRGVRRACRRRHHLQCRMAFRMFL